MSRCNSGETIFYGCGGVCTVHAKVLKLALDDYGSYLGMEKGCYIIKNRKGEVARFPQFEDEIGEVVLKTGNAVSTGALASLGFWGIDCLIMTQKGHPVAILKSLDDDSHVETRICQYEALNNGKCMDIAKAFVTAKLNGQNEVLKKYGLRRFDYSVFESVKSAKAPDLVMLRRKLMNIEGQCSTRYFSQVFGLFNEGVKPSNRKTYNAYDGLNNLFNLAYRTLFWKVHIALIRAKLEPYLGFLHSLKFGAPSLVCDFLELYRYLIDDFVIDYARDLKPKDFVIKAEDYSSNRKGKRQYLDDAKTGDFTKKLNNYFKTTVEVPRIMRGERQEIETLINEEALLFAKYLRNERNLWSPRVIDSVRASSKLGKVA